jgi:hypothetical protein
VNRQPGNRAHKGAMKDASMMSPILGSPTSNDTNTEIVSGVTLEVLGGPIG